MRKTFLFLLLIAPLFVLGQKHYYPNGVKPGTTSVNTTTRVIAGSTDSLAQFGITNGLKYYDIFTASQINAMFPAISFTRQFTLSGSTIGIKDDTLTGFNYIALRNDSGNYTHSTGMYWFKAGARFNVVAPIDLASTVYFRYAPLGGSTDSVYASNPIDGSLEKIANPGGGSSVNIYNADGVLTGDRLLNTATHALRIQNGTIVGSSVQNTGLLLVGNTAIVQGKNNSTGVTNQLQLGSGTSFIALIDSLLGTSKIEVTEVGTSTTHGVKVTDNIYKRGLIAAANYDANLIPASYITKRAADSLYASSGGSGHTLTLGYGLLGGSYNGSSAVTTLVDSTVFTTLNLLSTYLPKAISDTSYLPHQLAADFDVFNNGFYFKIDSARFGRSSQYASINNGNFNANSSTNFGSLVSTGLYFSDPAADSLFNISVNTSTIGIGGILPVYFNQEVHVNTQTLGDASTNTANTQFVANAIAAIPGTTPYTAGYGLNLTSFQFKADSAVLKTKASALADYNNIQTQLSAKQATITASNGVIKTGINFTSDTTYNRSVANSYSLSALQTKFNLYQKTVSLTTTGNNGASTFNSSTGALNIPTYTLVGLLPSLTTGSVLYYNGTTVAQDNANFFWDGTNHWLGLATTVPTNSLTFSSTSTGYKHFLTSDQVTNTQSISGTASGGTYTLLATNTGSAAAPTFNITNNNGTLNLSGGGTTLALGGTTSTTAGFGNLTRSSSAAVPLFSLTGTTTASSSIADGLVINRTYNQTSTAGGTDIKVLRTETGVGSGAQLFQDFQVAGVSKYSVTDLGALILSSTITAGSGVYVSGASSITAFSSSGVATNADFSSGTTGSMAQTTAGIEIGAVQTYSRSFFNGSTAAAPVANNPAINVIFGNSSAITLPATGTTPYAGNVYFKATPTITNASSIPLTRTATVGIEGAGSGGALNDAFYVASGTSEFGGNVTLNLANRLFIGEGTNGIVGQTTLVTGTKAITITGITTSSRAILTFVSVGGTVSTTWQYAGVCTSNTLTITALTNAGTTDTTDTSTLNYEIIN